MRPSTFVLKLSSILVGNFAVWQKRYMLVLTWNFCFVDLLMLKSNKDSGWHQSDFICLQLSFTYTRSRVSRSFGFIDGLDCQHMRWASSTGYFVNFWVYDRSCGMLTGFFAGLRPWKNGQTHTRDTGSGVWLLPPSCQQSVNGASLLILCRHSTGSQL